MENGIKYPGHTFIFLGRELDNGTSFYYQAYGFYPANNNSGLLRFIGVNAKLDYQYPRDMNADTTFRVNISRLQETQISQSMDEWKTKPYATFWQNCTSLSREAARISGLVVPEFNPANMDEEIPTTFVLKLRDANVGIQEQRRLHGTPDLKAIPMTPDETAAKDYHMSVADLLKWRGSPDRIQSAERWISVRDNDGNLLTVRYGNLLPGQHAETIPESNRASDNNTSSNVTRSMNIIGHSYFPINPILARETPIQGYQHYWREFGDRYVVHETRLVPDGVTKWRVVGNLDLHSGQSEPQAISLSLSATSLSSDTSKDGVSVYRVIHQSYHSYKGDEGWLLDPAPLKLSTESLSVLKSGVDEDLELLESASGHLETRR